MIEKMKALPKKTKIILGIVAGMIILAIIGAFMPDAPEDKEVTTEQTETTEAPVNETFDLEANYVYDDLFEKYMFVFEITIENHRTREDRPNHNFRFFGPNGAEVQRTFVHKYNGNDCGLTLPTLRPGGTITCTVAYEVNYKGIHELEVWLGKRGPWKTYRYEVE